MRTLILLGGIKMKPKELLEILSVAEKLKCNTRHCYTSSGRRESVAEHSWRISLMAMLLTKEFPEADMDKVIRMCLIHDMGEAFTGDIPTFEKTNADTRKEDDILLNWVNTLPEDAREEWAALLTEMNAMETQEAKIYKALDKMEAVIQHNESDISTWLPLEYDLQLTYGEENVQFSPYMQQLKAEATTGRERRSPGRSRNKAPQYCKTLRMTVRAYGGFCRESGYRLRRTGCASLRSSRTSPAAASRQALMML